MDYYKIFYKDSQENSTSFSSGGDDEGASRAEQSSGPELPASGFWYRLCYFLVSEPRSNQSAFLNLSLLIIRQDKY